MTFLTALCDIVKIYFAALLYYFNTLSRLYTKGVSDMKPKLIHFSEEHAAVIKAAANSLGMTFTAFVRMAAIKEAEQS